VTTIGIFSVKGSPGATTLALALAAHGRERGAVLVEADAAGGDLALRLAIAQHPGLAQLAARARQAADRRDVLDGLIRTVDAGSTGPVDLVPAPVEPAAVRAALSALAANPEAISAAGRHRPVLLDFGRLEPGSPGFALARSCQVLALLVRGDVASLGHAREAAWIREAPGRVGFVLVDTGPYQAAEAAEVLAMPCLGTVPFTRRPPGGRRAANTVRTLWAALTAPIAGPMTAARFAEVRG
jgi:hypothetical protein